MNPKGFGMLAVAAKSGEPAQARRLLDLLMDALKPQWGAADGLSR
ncbi:hypothetical protein [Streptomyces violascens]|nr:hypothetical protein [Streptomyces violascens]